MQTGDAITLTLPCERRFLQTARLVVAALATRLDMPYEQMDDLQLAVETVLGKHGAPGETTTVEFEIGPEALVIGVGPLTDSVGDSGDGDELDTRRLLGALVERVETIEKDGQTWLRLEDGIRSRA